MAEHAKLTARLRSIIGKQSKCLRRSGMLLGIIFGPAIPAPRPVSGDAHLFVQLYRQARTTNPVELAVNGEHYLAFIRRVERHPRRQDILHIDFYASNPA
ncbi:MAG TPA: hypothetical protein VFS96_04000 [Nitrolancea sp.]|nr:hypothetical protein [Nitrolancea sp.]